ncbi:sugar-binding transcriptional regulator [Georgenia thermotolerans]|nr:sugar-binding domain-containing protein [Georgenia thermotolerans]
MVEAARQYYLQDVSKVQIAANLGLSRFKVARLLEAARAQGIVTIEIHDGGLPVPELADELSRVLRLRRAVVIEAPEEGEEARRLVGAAAATMLGETLREGEVVGMAWGRTLTAMSASMPPLPRVDVVQLTGAVGGDLEASPVEVVRRIALRSGGTATPIFAPLVVDDPRAAEALRRQHDVARALRMFDTVTTAVVAVGSWDPPASQLWSALEPSERERLQDEGVRAEVTAILVSDSGEVLAPRFAERCIAIHADQLRRVPRVVAVAGGREKARAVAAIARAGLCTELVTDRSLAETVLEHAGDRAAL